MGCMVITKVVMILSLWENNEVAELNLYKCKKCGWEIEAPSEGADILMDGGIAYFICNNCKNGFCRTFEFGNEDELDMSCPKCKSQDITGWKPEVICPKCGGELEDLGISCLVD